MARGPDHCVYRPDGSRIPGMRWIEQTAAQWIRSEQVPRWQKPAALKDPTSLLVRLTHRFYTRFLHGRVAEPKDTGASDNDYPSLSLSVFCFVLFSLMRYDPHAYAFAF